MRKFKMALFALAIVGAPFSAAGTASASHSYTFTGSLDVFKGIQLNCAVSVVKTPSHVPGMENTGTVVLNIGPPENNCALLTINSNPHDYEQGPAGVDRWRPMWIRDIDVTTISVGDCYGDLLVEKRPVNVDPITGIEDLTGPWEMRVNSSIAAGSAGGPCIISGTIET